MQSSYTAYCCFAILLLACLNEASKEPVGRLYLRSVFIQSFLQTYESDAVNITVTCHTSSSASRVQFEYYTVSKHKKLYFKTGHDLGVDLLPHESVECELTETMHDKKMQDSHGFCDFTYGRYLGAKDNTVRCHLGDGSVFAVKMECKGGCPDPEAPAITPYCAQAKQLLPVKPGRPRSFTDGSPGFAMYAPESHCSWILPREGKGVTTFLFSRFDLGDGDVIIAYESNGRRRKKLKKYDSESVPESVSTRKRYLILELLADDKDEGLGFEGFYYYSEDAKPPVAIAASKEDGPSLQSCFF